MRVDGKVSGEVPHARVDALWLARRDMLKHKVVELMLEHIFALRWCQFLKELRVVDHLKLSRVRVDTHPSSRDVRGGRLVDAATERGEEWLVAQQADDVMLKVESLSHFGSFVQRLRIYYFKFFSLSRGKYDLKTNSS